MKSHADSILGGQNIIEAFFARTSEVVLGCVSGNGCCLTWPIEYILDMKVSEPALIVLHEVIDHDSQQEHRQPTKVEACLDSFSQ